MIKSLFVFLFVYLFCFYANSQISHEYDSYDRNTVIGDTTISVSFSSYKNHPLLNERECFRVENGWDYLEYMDSKELDSVLLFVRSFISKNIGNEVSRRTDVYKVHYYNDPNDKPQDSTSIAEFKKRGAYCLDMRYVVECYVQLDEDIWFPYNVFIDTNGELIISSSIINKLKNMSSFKIKPIDEIFKTAYLDPYMKNKKASGYMQLHYSEKLKLFYFEIEAGQEDDTTQENNFSSTCLVRHVFIDAFTGKVLWRTKAKHYNESIGCVIRFEITYKTNALTGN